MVTPQLGRRLRQFCSEADYERSPELKADYERSPELEANYKRSPEL